MEQNSILSQQTLIWVARMLYFMQSSMQNSIQTKSANTECKCYRLKPEISKIASRYITCLLQIRRQLLAFLSVLHRTTSAPPQSGYKLQIKYKSNSSYSLHCSKLLLTLLHSSSLLLFTILCPSLTNST